MDRREWVLRAQKGVEDYENQGLKQKFYKKKNAITERKKNIVVRISDKGELTGGQRGVTQTRTQNKIIRGKTHIKPYLGEKKTVNEKIVEKRRRS